MAESVKQAEEVYLTCQSRYWHIRVHDGDTVVTAGRVGVKDVKPKTTKYENQAFARQACDKLVMKMKRKGYTLGVQPIDPTDADEPAKKRARTEADAARIVKLTTAGGQKIGMRLVAANVRKETGLRITEVVPGGQASKTGSISANDIVTHVNGVDVQQMSLAKAKKLMTSADTFELTVTDRPLFGLRDKDVRTSDSQSLSPSGAATCKVCKNVVSLLSKIPYKKWRCDSCNVDGFTKSDKMFACATLKKCDYGMCDVCFQKNGGDGTSDTKSKQSTISPEPDANTPAASSASAPVANILAASGTCEPVVIPPATS